jgi:hypothetical protein
MADPLNINDDKSSLEKYFAAEDAERLANICLNKASSFYNILTMNYYLDNLVRMWLYYHGQYNATIAGDSHRVSFMGEEGELVGLPVNHFRNIAQHMLNMITANRPTMEARAVNTDYKSLSQTYLANGILDYYMREKKLEEVIRKATEMAIVLGAGFVRMEWNATAGELYDFDPETGEKNFEGELEFSNLSPFDVVFDGTKETWDHEWIMIRTFQNRFNLMAKYPELAERIGRMPTKNYASQYRLSVFSNDNTDDIPVYEFFHKRSEALPEGRYVMFLDDDLVLLDLPLPYRDIPVYRIAAGDYMGTPYGYSPMFDVFPLQEAANSLYSTIMTNQSAFGVQNLFVPRGADLDINSLEGALNILEGNAKPEPLNLTQTPAEVFKFLEMIIQGMETVSGVNSVTRGNPEASLKSGTALALVQSMSLQFISGLQNNYVKLIEDVGTSLINILKDYAKTPKTVALAGKNNRSFLKQFTGDEVGAINRVIVSVGNPLARTTAGRVQMAEQMLQMGLIKNPKEYFEVINTGSIDSMWEGDMNEILLIKKENEILMSGKPVMAELLDQHAQHIMEHRTVMADPDLRMNPELRMVVQQHIQEHIDYLRNVDPDLLMLTGQQPLQPPMPPMPEGGPMPPPPGGPMGSPPPNAGPMPPMPPMPPPPPAPPAAGPVGQPGDLQALLRQPSGMPPNPQDLITGQGSTGGEMIPGVPKPPAPFQNLPVTAQDMLPQS